MPVLQSAYRSGHSTESCLLKVMSDILDAADSGEVSLVGLLDLSAAFDTVDHDILLRRLQSSFGIGGIILHWITSFLTDRTQAVVFLWRKVFCLSFELWRPAGFRLGTFAFHSLQSRCHPHWEYGSESTLLCGRYTAVHQWFWKGRDDNSFKSDRVHQRNQFMDVIKPLETEWRQDPVYLDGFTPTVIKDPSRCPDHSRCWALSSPFSSWSWFHHWQQTDNVRSRQQCRP